LENIQIRAARFVTNNCTDRTRLHLVVWPTW
jgi:hypothetical protein